VTSQKSNILVLLGLLAGLSLAMPVSHAAANSGADTSRPTVLVCPLRQIDQTAADGWLGRAVQQSLEITLARDAGVRTAEPAPGADANQLDPVSAARSSGAAMVVTGGFQVVNGQVRLSCRLLDGQDGSLLSAWNTDGPADDLLRLEDECGDRAARAVRSALWDRANPATAQQSLSREQAAATISWVTSPRVAATPRPVAGQRDPRPFDDRADLAKYHYYYSYPAWGCCGYGLGYFWPCGVWGWGCGFLGGPQATVGFYSQGSN
jgi:TolB-like protein